MLAHSAPDGLRNERRPTLPRKQSGTETHSASTASPKSLPDSRISIKKTDIDLADPAKDDIVSFETDARQSDGRITLLRANIEANVVCAILEQTCEGNSHAQQWWHSLREMSAQTLPPPIKELSDFHAEGKITSRGTRLKTPRRILPPYTSAESGRRVFYREASDSAPLYIAVVQTEAHIP